jgi:N utilization substance protein A
MDHFGQIEGVTEELADKLVGEGYLSYDDLSVIEPEELMELGGLTEEEVESIVEQAEAKAEEAERAAADERRRQRDAEKQAPKGAAPPAAEQAPAAEPERGEAALGEPVAGEMAETVEQGEPSTLEDTLPTAESESPEISEDEGLALEGAAAGLGQEEEAPAEETSREEDFETRSAAGENGETAVEDEEPSGSRQGSGNA